MIISKASRLIPFEFALNTTWFWTSAQITHNNIVIFFCIWAVDTHTRCLEFLLVFLFCFDVFWFLFIGTRTLQSSLCLYVFKFRSQRFCPGFLLLPLYFIFIFLISTLFLFGLEIVSLIRNIVFSIFEKNQPSC